MPPAANTLSTRYAIKLTGNPTTIVAKRAALEGEATMLIAADHMLALLLPDTFDRVSYQPLIGVPLSMLEYLLYTGLILDGPVSNSGVHFALEPARLAQLFKDLDDSGTAYEPIHGADKEALKKAAELLTCNLLFLPRAQRLVTLADLIFDDDPNSAETGTWFDYMTPLMITSGGGGMDLLSQFLALIPQRYNRGANGGRDDDIFTGAIEQITNSVGRDISQLSPAAQAAVVAQWIKVTRPPPGFTFLIANPTESAQEIERRAGPTIAARFMPLFELYWRYVYKLLDTIWPHPVADIINDTAGLMVGLDLSCGSDGLTPFGVRALVTTLQEYAPFATGATNEERTQQIIHAHKHADDDKDLSAESKAILQANEPYQTFRASIERHAPDDHMGVAKTAMQSPHAAGLLLLNKLLKGDILFKERLGATTEAILQAIVNKAVAKNNRGEEVDDWPNLITGEFAKKLIAGRFAEIHFWNALKAVVGKQQGKALVDKIDKRLATAPSAEVFADSEAMRYLEVPARAVMALIGFTSTDGNSFAAMLKTLMRLAAAIENMPATCEPRKGLRKALLETAAKLMQCPQTRWECMLATPATAVKRIGDFVTAGHALNAVNALEGHVDRFMKELDDGMHLLAKDAANNVRDEPTHKSEHKPEYGSEQKSGAAWGSSAAKYGITASTDGKRIAWGTQVVTDYETAPDTKTHCPGRFAPASSQHLWCWDPNACWAKGGEKAHERLPEFPKEACKASNVGKLTQPIDWDDMTITIVAPGQNRGGGGRNANGKRNREDDGQRQQGKGKGKGAGKGKGKGGGRNGGKGGGRGFQRQPQ